MRINKEGYIIIAVNILAVAIIFFSLCFFVPRSVLPAWALGFIGVLLVGLLVFIAAFFREPSRKIITDPDVIFAPADGKIVVVEHVYDSEFLKEDCIQISVFMSITNVHINWYPAAGEVVYKKYHPGKYMVAWHPKSSHENERMSTVVDTGMYRILMRQIAGMVARRIVNYAVKGQRVEQNDKAGFIKFGSRVDVLVPAGSQVLVNIGDKVTGSQTPLARLK